MVLLLLYSYTFKYIYILSGIWCISPEGPACVTVYIGFN